MRRLWLAALVAFLAGAPVNLAHSEDSLSDDAPDSRDASGSLDRHDDLTIYDSYGRRAGNIERTQTENDWGNGQIERKDSYIVRDIYGTAIYRGEKH